MMVDWSRCPPEQIVVDYAAGCLSDEDVAHIEAHLANCEACMDAVEWVRFHFFTAGNEAESSVADVRAVLTSDDKETSVATQVATDRFDLSVLMPSPNPCALGRLGEYDVMELIGYGGMGVVFKAYDEHLRRTVAIKALNHCFTRCPTARRRFIREGRAAAAINHPNIVIIYQVVDQQDQPFLVMEYFSGGTLRDRLRKEGRLDPMSVLRISTQIAAALHAAHRRGIVHRDVKPSNIMLEDGRERVKITDFGLARASIDNVELTTSDTAVGTPAYMAPEQVRGEKIDERADLFALGCVMYAMLVGQSPFHGKCSLQMSRKVLEDDPDPPEAFVEGIPAFLSKIIMRLLEKDPERRIQSAREVSEKLQAHLAILNQAAKDEANDRRIGKHRHLLSAKNALVMMALIVIACGSFFAWLAWH